MLAKLSKLHKDYYKDCIDLYNRIKGLTSSRTILILVFGSVALLFFITNFKFNKEYNLIIDPGHGGANVFQKDGKIVKNERWDPVKGKYLSYYLTGMEADTYHEHLVMLELGKKVKAYLDLTQSFWGWQRFEDILRVFSKANNGNKGNKFERITLKAKLTRKDSWNHRYEKADKIHINNDYRLYDYPDERARLRHGRLSFINHHRPSLVVSLHMTPAGKGNEGGMAGVLAPGFRSYDLVRRILLKEEKMKEWKKSYWNGKVLDSNKKAGWKQFELMNADSWGYFHGYRSNKKGNKINFSAARGIRHNLVSWAYKESDNWAKDYRPNQAGPYALKYRDFEAKGKFWDRERSQAESWRREGGPKLYGGDNHYATDELLRFVQHGVRILRPAMREKKKIGKIHFPFASSYALPIYVNAIVAFLEIGYLNRKRDRELIIGEMDAVAKSLAVGIYSLYAGLKIEALPDGTYLDDSKSKVNESDDGYTPKGEALDLEKYGDYFKSSVD